jgi:hypothetical protein
MPSLPLPSLVSIAQFDPGPPGPGYMDIFNSTMRNLATPADGFDPALIELAALSDGLGAELQSTSSLGLPDSVGISLLGTNPATLDGHMLEYVGSKDAGMAILMRAATTDTPPLREFPMDPSFDGGIGAPPTQKTINVGPLKLGSAPVRTLIGQQTSSANLGTTVGLLSVTLHDGDGAQNTIVVDDWTSGTGQLEKWTYFIVSTPLEVGVTFAEFNVISRDVPQNTILTLNLTVVA